MRDLPYITSQKGTALVLTLWLLALLSALALNFSMTARSGSAVTRNFKQSALARSLAVEAINNTVAYILADPDLLVDFIDEDGAFRTDAERPSISGITNTGTALLELTLSAEDSRLNINRIKQATFTNLLDAGGVSEEETGALVSSLLDWTDPDDLHRLGGAEDDYYGPLGYATSGMPLALIDELLLIRNFTEELVRGEDGGSGLQAHLTTFGESVNINAASSQVLGAIGLDSLVTASVMEMRANNQGLRRVPSGVLERGKTFSNFFRIEAGASLRQSPETYRITAIVERSRGKTGPQLKTIYWKEEIETGGA